MHDLIQVPATRGPGDSRVFTRSTDGSMETRVVPEPVGRSRKQTRGGSSTQEGGQDSTPVRFLCFPSRYQPRAGEPRRWRLPPRGRQRPRRPGDPRSSGTVPVHPPGASPRGARRRVESREGLRRPCSPDAGAAESQRRMASRTRPVERVRAGRQVDEHEGDGPPVANGPGELPAERNLELGQQSASHTSSGTTGERPPPPRMLTIGDAAARTTPPPGCTGGPPKLDTSR